MQATKKPHLFDVAWLRITLVRGDTCFRLLRPSFPNSIDCLTPSSRRFMSGFARALIQGTDPAILPTTRKFAVRL